ncbi:hypothetical protein MTO96_034850 [Rhipicephalus appendiculatus]
MTLHLAGGMGRAAISPLCTFAALCNSLIRAPLFLHRLQWPAALRLPYRVIHFLLDLHRMRLRCCGCSLDWLGGEQLCSSTFSGSCNCSFTARMTPRSVSISVSEARSLVSSTSIVLQRLHTKAVASAASVEWEVRLIQVIPSPAPVALYHRFLPLFPLRPLRHRTHV